MDLGKIINIFEGRKKKGGGEEEGERAYSIKHQESVQAMITKPMWCLCSIKWMSGWHCMQSSEICVDFDIQHLHWGKEILLNNWSWKKMWKKISFCLLHTIHNYRWIKNLNIKSKMFKFSLENLDGIFSDLELGKDFLK